MIRTTKDTTLWYMKNDMWCHFHAPLFEIYNANYRGDYFEANTRFGIDTDLSIFENTNVCIAHWGREGVIDLFEYNRPIFIFNSILLFDYGHIDTIHRQAYDSVLLKEYRMIGKLIG
jgi:hypothetical protein